MGYKHSIESITTIKLAKIGKYDGSNNPFFGKVYFEYTLKLMSEVKKNKYIGSKNTFFSKKHNAEAIDKIITNNLTRKIIYVYDFRDLSLICQFRSIREAIKRLKTSLIVFYRSLDTDIKFRN